MPLKRSRVAGERSISTRVGDGVIALAAANEQARQTSRRRDPHLELVPFAVVLEVFRPVANRILMPEFQRDALEKFVHLGCRVREESLATGNCRQLIQTGLTSQSKRTGRIIAAENANGVEH